MNIRIQTLFLALASLLCATAGHAQTAVSEDFTGTTTTNSWYYSGGACLTEGNTTAGTGTEFTSTVAGSPGVPPGCNAIKNNSDAYGGESLVGGVSGTLPDTGAGNGALRFTNGCINGNCGNGSGGGHNQFGAIISSTAFSSSAGVQVTFKTVTYRGDSGGGDGADGMTFFLQDASVSPNDGQYGGSLAYSCSNQNGNYGYTGMVGAYIGLGIDEYGNFLNGSTNSLGEIGSTLNGNDNTATGGLFQANRIGMRGAGNVAWSWLHANYANYYPSSLNSTQQAAAVQNTCKTGTLWDYSTSTSGSNTGLTHTGTKPILYDYPAIPNAYTVLSGVTIANEYSNGGLYRVPTSSTATNGATPIFYKVKITSAGLLSLNYSVNGANWLSVLSNQSILASNGALPANIRFGFAGSTGGSSNIHEVLCFKAAAADAASSSAASNQTQSSRVTSSTQVYFSYYDPNDWTGRLTANMVSSDSTGALTISPTATWDASCVLTGGSSCTSTGVTTANIAENWQASGGTSSVLNRQIITYNYNNLLGTGTGVPFQYTSLSLLQQAALTIGDLNGSTRLNYLRGDRSNELTTNSAGATTGLFRDRDYVLGDIVNSSPVAVGQPVSPYAAPWADKLYTSATPPENGGTQNYAAFVTAERTRQNMVYVGANDGMVHGFRAGAFNSSNVYTIPNSTNDGNEMIAYVPGSLLYSAAASNGTVPCVSTLATQSAVQNIHGVTPVILSAVACTQPTLDYSSSLYGHNFFVDATPAAGDLFYNGGWHTWLVGGLGAGGGAIYALDVTTPANFSESNASSLVIGEWTAASISCNNSPAVTSCGSNLGATYGTPLIRRMHNGMWALIFGNGFGSSTGDAGIYIITIDPSTTSITTKTYYLSTGTAGSNGIAYVTSADLDGDHVTDYLYAGDLLGNVWRFDVTSNTATSWAGSSNVLKLFTTQTGQPITSSLLVAAVTGNAPGTQVMVAFGTGRKTSPTNVNPVSYASAGQSLYAVWDPNFTTWNTNSSATQYASLSTVPALTASKLTAETLSIGNANTLDITTYTICWAGTASCTGSSAKYGWYANLVGTNEQVIYNPQLVGSAFSVNSLIPANNSAISCSTNSDGGYTYAISLATGSLPAANGGGTSTIFGNTTSTSINASGSSSGGSSGGSSSGSTTTTTTANTDSHAVALLTNATGTSTQMTTSTTTASTGINANGTGSSVSCTLGGICNNIPTSLTTYAGPFSAVSGCSSGDSYLVYQTTTAGAQATRISPNCPLTGSRTTRSQIR